MVSRKGIFERQVLINWSLIFGCWTFVAFCYTSQTIVQNASAGKQESWWLILKVQLVFCYLWFALTPAVLWLSERFPIERGLINILVHTGASVFLSALHIALFIFLHSLMSADGRQFFDRLEEVFVSDFFFFRLYWIIFCVNYAIKYFKAYQERMTKTAELEASLARFELQVLKQQLQPHFLFNTLNTISELVHEDSKAADKMIVRLSGLLRGSLETTGVQELTLKQEMEFLQKYLDIEQIRYEERLIVKMEIAPETLDALVPSMILQPLVENAVRHSIAPRNQGGRVQIRAECKDAKLQISIEDDGQLSNRNGAPKFKEKIGLSNTRGRLVALYGAAQRFDLKLSSMGGLAVKIEIPFKTAIAEARNEN